MTQTTDITELMTKIGAEAKAAAAELASATAERKHAALISAAENVWTARAEIIAANAQDLDFGRSKGLSDAMMDRLLLDEARIQSIVDGLRAIAEQADPVGEVMAEWTQPSGLNIKRVRTPLGVIGVIYESRPNVTADAGALCLKAGNAVILRGGSESFHSSQAIHACLVQGLRMRACQRQQSSLCRHGTARPFRQCSLCQIHIDVIVPRGGKGLVGLVQREARVPVFAHLEGIVPYLRRCTRRPGHGLASCLERQNPPYRNLRRC